MRARDIMTKGVVSIAESATIYEAAELMVSTRVSGLPVLDSTGILVGVVSEADLIGRGETPGLRNGDALLRRISEDVSEAIAFVKAHSNVVRDIMSRGVVTISEDTRLEEIAQLMLQRRIKRLPVLRGSQLVGMVSRINLVQALISSSGQRPVGTAAGPAGATAAAPSAAAPSAAAPSAPPTDQQIEAAVDSAIRVHRWSSANVDVTVVNGVAHLWGLVADPAIRRAYLLSIEKVAHVRDIVDHTHIVPPHLVGQMR